MVYRPYVEGIGIHRYETCARRRTFRPSRSKTWTAFAQTGPPNHLAFRPSGTPCILKTRLCSHTKSGCPGTVSV